MMISIVVQFYYFYGIDQLPKLQYFVNNMLEIF